MTLPTGSIAISDINAELGLAQEFSSSLSFLAGYMKSPPANPNIGSFRGLAYYQRNADGNCNNGNCSASGGPNGNCTNPNSPNACTNQGSGNGNCTSACNCGNIQCNNCVIAGPSNCANCQVCTANNCSNCQVCTASNCANCANCSTINCSNCDGQNFLQDNCNCACTYNCTQSAVSYNCNTSSVSYNCSTTAVSYNCVTGETSYACNCACNCSKIICAKLYDFGLMDYRVWMADQQYGEWLKKHDRSVFKGYIKWARIVTAWMDGNGPDYLVWIKDKQLRSTEQKRTSTEWAQKIGTPWAEHMAFLMGAVPNDNLKGRVIMTIGRPICKFVNLLPKRSNPGTLTSWMMWSMFFMSHYVSEAVVKSAGLIKKIKSSNVFSAVKGTTR